jgi:hypothetical protein
MTADSTVPTQRVSTTGIRVFAKCRTLYRVFFVEHSAKAALPRAALGKVPLSTKTLSHSAKPSIPIVFLD